MSWSRPEELKAQLAKRWERGDFLRDAVTENSSFPVRLSLKAPSSTDITDRFPAVRAWAATLITELGAREGLRVTLYTLNHRVQGTQDLPDAVWVDTREAALAWLGQRKAWSAFVAQVAETRQREPALLPWLEKSPIKALALAEHWPKFLAVVGWLRAHPRPDVYLRQVDLPGIHSKFIESHRGVLAELLDLALPATAVEARYTGVSQFAARYGFRDKPSRIRFRLLDATVPLVPGLRSPDVTLDAESFGQLSLAVRRVFITENETNFLAFPPVPQALVIFGAGYGWEALARADWLKSVAIHYWGDLDTHGFGILDQLRGHFGEVVSLLMDRATLHAHEAVWGREDKPLRAELQRLTPDERALYVDLRDDRIRPGLRLEQEHIGFEWLAQHVQRLG